MVDRAQQMQHLLAESLPINRSSHLSSNLGYKEQAAISQRESIPMENHTTCKHLHAQTTSYFGSRQRSK
uniref:Uncharacterized protein n=1 Tax=Nelumbo nucifera TaxID=4432 RepID=A0A822XMD7_NELNU|nr:TPA_asm: hypothetical protein HUJ06_021398 [Nelumbo nucifera]